MSQASLPKVRSYDVVSIGVLADDGEESFLKDGGFIKMMRYLKPEPKFNIRAGYVAYMADDSQSACFTGSAGPLSSKDLYTNGRIVYENGKVLANHGRPQPRDVSILTGEAGVLAKDLDALMGVYGGPIKSDLKDAAELLRKSMGK